MSWEIVSTDSEILAIHAALLPTNQVLMFGGSEHNSSQSLSGNPADLDNTRLFNLTPGASPLIETVGSPTTDVFCAGQAFLGDGRLLVAGGTEAWGGQPDAHAHALDFLGERGCWIYAPRQRVWRRVRDLNFQPGESTGGGRWYPTLVTLATGQVLCVSGHPSALDTRHHNDTQERYVVGSDTWVHLTAELFDPGTMGPSDRLYPRFHLLPDGTVFFVTPFNGSSRRWNPFTGTTTATFGSPGGGLYDSSWDFASVLLPLLPGNGYEARVLVTGDVNPRIIDLDAATPSWQNTAPRQGAAAGRRRRFGQAVLLPSGEVFVNGGIDGGMSDSNAVRAGELYNPGIDWATGQYSQPDSWQTVEQAGVVRNYHSTALLLPDGRVWTAGSSKNAAQGDPASVGELRIEVYKPPYDGDADRPVLTAVPPSAGYGQFFDVTCPQAGDIARVALTRTGSTTHAFDADQRYVGLAFELVDEDRLRVTAPPNSAIAPPGYYLLWVLDEAGLPCQQARFIRICDQGIELIFDRSTFSTHEVTALGTPATFSNALYVVLRNYLPSEAGQPLVTPTLTFARPNGSPVPGMSAVLHTSLYEDPSIPPDVGQRTTFVFALRFSTLQAFNEIPEDPGWVPVTVTAQHGGNRAQGTLTLTRNPNPYMRDGDVHWLSTDLRVFTMRPGQTRAGVTMGSGAAGATSFVQSLVSAFNGTPTDEDHPWFGLPTDAPASQLELATGAGGQPVFNFAVARVRFRAPGGVAADDVRVFFRMFTTASTSFVYNAQAYPRTADGATAAPLLGLAGGEILSIPFYAEQRQTDMTAQVDATNRRTLSGTGAQEISAYFGCWLDFNQTTPRFPLYPAHNGSGGPFGGSLLSIQELVRNHHCCLVAEVHYVNDLIPSGATPGSHENLAQRNLVVVESDNPGGTASHTVQTTFEIKPSPVPLNAEPVFGHGAVFPEVFAKAPPAARQRVPADELMLRWFDLPPDSRVAIYAPDIDVNLVAEIAGTRTGADMVRPRQQELLCRVGGATYVPIPGPRATEIPALLTVELPPTVTAGQEYRMTLHQIGGPAHQRRILGSFQVTVMVREPAGVLATTEHHLAVFKHIGQAIPADNRWAPIWMRLISNEEDKVRELGGDPDRIDPSPHGRPEREERPGEPEPPRPGVRDVMRGVVSRLRYDCFGRFEGFELVSCDKSVFVTSCERGVERVARKACRDRCDVTVWLADEAVPRDHAKGRPPGEHSQRKSARRIEINCC